MLGLQSMAADFGESLHATVRTDSSAALAISQRVGLGKVRHIQVQYLWIQEKHADETLGMHKVKGELNPADMLTKGVPQEILNRHMRTTSLHPRGGMTENTGRQVGLIQLNGGVALESTRDSSGNKIHCANSSLEWHARLIRQQNPLPDQGAALAADMAARTIIRIGIITPKVVNNLYNIAL